MNFSNCATILLYFVFILISYTESSLSENSSRIEQNDLKKDPVKDERVIGGRDVIDGERPFQVVILVRGQFICGGSLIKPNVVLTAAHCVNGYAFIQILTSFKLCSQFFHEIIIKIFEIVIQSLILKT